MEFIGALMALVSVASRTLQDVGQTEDALVTPRPKNARMLEELGCTQMEFIGALMALVSVASRTLQKSEAEPVIVESCGGLFVLIVATCLP
eukprot:scaffold12767_cov43-Cyclotella_meneghiniana.AAC.1